MNKLVSVVIPTYNYARFVGRAIDSVLAQTYSRVECIVVDDGSTDETPQVLARYGERIRVVRQENKGLSGARNTGVVNARGEYIAILDSDDYWRPDKLALQVAYHEANPGLGVVGCAGEEVDRGGARVNALPFRDRRDEFPDLTSQLRAVATRRYWVGCSGSGAMIPRGVFDDVGLFDETLRAAEDWDMWLRIAAKYPVANVGEVLASVCVHGTGSFRNAEKMEANQWKVYHAALERWPDRIDGATRRKMRALILADAGGEYVFGKEYKMALRRYMSSLLQWPMHRRRWYLVARLLFKQVAF